ncbi:FAD:protein FMN transferase [Luteolibacter sp. SL250]|uniref:FAD:protein FMN transferase n=1 Tax=Luteolibacter sp. SL250 TaxID=2995170 RepID=UPI00226EC893|nr:FAD:protein FMN transferase [Luteolibacter sp. SL250]WAC20766.1 FAD:protein FMN transferase [Luteolibacter sp. SL250]
MPTRRRTLLLIAAALGLPRAGAAPEGGYRFQRGLMGTRFMVTCYHEEGELVGKAVAAAFAEADRINEAASDYIADSELLSIGKVPPGTPVRVSPLLFGLLEEAWAQAEKTGGLFDPTVGPLTRLWRESRRRKALPDAATLAKAKAAIGWKKLVLDPAESTATFTVPDMRLDLGGIAKGQAADRMLAILGKHGVPCSSVTAGGDVRMGDPPPGKEGWNIGVRNRDVDRNAAELVLRNKAVSTSGDLRQFIEIGGVRYSHIVDPATGLGLTRPVSATIIAVNAATSDALATACCIADRETGRKLAAAQGAEVFLAEG